VPSALQTPQSIFKSNVKDVVTDGAATVAQLCAGAAYAATCKSLGIS